MKIIKCLCLVPLALLTSFVHSQVIPVMGLTTGISSATGERPARQNINVLQATAGPAWDLYILALSDMQTVSEGDELSYFQIADSRYEFPLISSGIHGRPYTSWNGVGPVAGSVNTGYCAHSEVSFALWHRPYLALFEQVVGSHAQRIASKYTGREASRYKAAAQTLRIPYWDWATDSTLPAAANQPMITVRGPRGKEFPLNGTSNYFPPAVGSNVLNNTETRRFINGATDTLGTLAGQLRSQVMATASYSSASLEDPHDTVHNYGGVTMVSLDVAAFDPLFWLHHCNVDRMIALWQAINYNDTYQTQSSITGGLYATPRGGIITAESPLKPFYQAGGRSFHTAVTASAIKSFGYTYPEINDWSYSAEQLRMSAVTQVNQLYSNNTAPVIRRSEQLWARSSWREYYAEVSVDRAELDLPCTISVMVEGALAGSMAVPSMPSCGIKYSRIPLTQAIGTTASGLGATEFTLFLQEQFKVEILKSDGSAVSWQSVPSLRVNLKGEEVTAPPTMDEFPIRGLANSYLTIGTPQDD
ncbi:hypothetical protein BX600DRAFT_436061 [Xylariales sp. PMI_506]|nr:hypothetical protein BX600DRAFT_436061 [Xylariales sp. PMI_506]